MPRWYAADRADDEVEEEESSSEEEDDQGEEQEEEAGEGGAEDDAAAEARAAATERAATNGQAGPSSSARPRAKILIALGSKGTQGKANGVIKGNVQCHVSPGAVCTMRPFVQVTAQLPGTVFSAAT